MFDKIILASASPRRRELMEQAGYQFTVIPGCGKEIITKSLPNEIVEELSAQKAAEIRPGKQELIIGADTIVAFNGQIMGKPKNVEDACSMLSVLQGNTHQVYTGVTLRWYSASGIQSRTFSECTQVSVYPMTVEEIQAYAATKEPMDKAGAYGIQGQFAVYIKEIHGDYNNVVGLPIARLYHEIKMIDSTSCSSGQ